MWSKKMTQSHCNSCFSMTEHKIVKTINEHHCADDDGSIFIDDTYEILQCCGCGAVSLRHTEFFSEEPPAITKIYPPELKRKLPDWTPYLCEPLNRLLKEIYAAYSVDARALAAMGIRSIVDDVANDKVGDCGGFNEKLKELEAKELITHSHRVVLDAALEVGHAATHRSYQPSPNEIEDLLDIIENLLQSTYVLGEIADGLRCRTPKRKRPRAKTISK